MRTRAVSSPPRAHSILLTCRCTSSVREARKPLRDNNHGQTASHLCQEFWIRVSVLDLAGRLVYCPYMASIVGKRAWEPDLLLPGGVRSGERHTHASSRRSTWACLLYTSPSPRDGLLSRMP